METAGYSGTPLPKKLGVKAGHRVLLAGAPDGFELDPLPDGVEVRRRPGPKPYDVVLGFAANQAEMRDRFAALKPRIDRAGALWLCWPKKASGVPTDLTENVVRDAGLAAGLVDVKVCAVNAVWSGLKFVYRLADR